MEMDTCIGFVCKEDLKKSNRYTTLAKLNVEFWSKKYPVYVMTNNLKEFRDLDCKLLFDDEYFSNFDKFKIINKLQRGYKKIIYIDCDELFNDFDINLHDIPEGIHSFGTWPDNWENLKNLPYFKIWKENINVDDMVSFPCESVFILNTNKSWKETYDEIIKYKTIAKLTELNSTVDENPHHGVERCEAIGLYAGCKLNNFPLYFNSKYVEPFYNSMKYHEL
jgi:hypothetical protein